MAERWREHVLALARAERAAAAAARRPTGREELLVYQTLVGAWPIEPERLEPYLEKALREAKRNTSWVEPERARGRRASIGFARALYEHEPFLADFDAVRGRGRRRRRALGARAAGAPATSPGVPDIYDGRRAAVPRARRSRQPPARRLMRRRRACSRRAGRAPEPRDAKLFVIREPLALRAAARRPSRARTSRSRRRRARAPSAAATT